MAEKFLTTRGELHKANPSQGSIVQASLSSWDTMGLLFVLWLCTLPLIGLLLVPLVGTATAVGVAAVLLIVMLVGCWARYLPQTLRRFSNRGKPNANSTESSTLSSPRITH